MAGDGVDRDIDGDGVGIAAVADGVVEAVGAVEVGIGGVGEAGGSDRAAVGGIGGGEAAQRAFRRGGGYRPGEGVARVGIGHGQQTVNIGGAGVFVDIEGGAGTVVEGSLLVDGQLSAVDGGEPAGRGLQIECLGAATTGCVGDGQIRECCRAGSRRNGGGAAGAVLVAGHRHGR